MNSKLSEFLSTVAKKVDDYIFSNIKGQPEELYEASLHIIRSGGKRVRPAILMASGLIFTNNEEDLIPFAASVELIHTFTLIHDDIMDKDEYRRGVKTVHTIWGEPIAITAGDLLFAKAFEIITNDDVRKRIDASRLAWAAHELSKATATVAEGQALDMSFENRKWVTLNEYLRMVYMKTGALLEASAKIGGIIAGASPENVRLLGEYASKIGIAFQIRDDYLGLYGREEVIGKAVFNDIRRGKKTFFVSLAYQRGDDELKALLDKLLGNQSAPREELEKLAMKMESAGIKKEAEDYMEKLMGKAIEAISSLKNTLNNEYIEILKELAIFIVKREK
jgi:geranylgeranyl diphosphate synthase type I